MLISDYRQKKVKPDAQTIQTEPESSSPAQRLEDSLKYTHVQFDLKDPMLMVAFSHGPDHRLLESRIESLEGELQKHKALHSSAKRQNASLKADLEISKRRESLLLDLLRHERNNNRPIGAKLHKVDPADLEMIRSEIAPKLSKEDIVRAIRSSRDER